MEAPAQDLEQQQVSSEWQVPSFEGLLGSGGAVGRASEGV